LIGLIGVLLSFLAKPAKKTTSFSLSQTTWKDNAMAKSSELDLDSSSDSVDHADRKQFSDVRILLEEKRKVGLVRTVSLFDILAVLNKLFREWSMGRFSDVVGLLFDSHRTFS